MWEAVKAGIAYFAIVFAFGFLLGVIRTLVLIPTLGELIAVAIELPVILLASWMICRCVIAHLQVPPLLRHRLLVGVVAFNLLMMAELGLSMVLVGRSMPEHFALYETAPALLGLIAQIAFALFPVLQVSADSACSRHTLGD
jgi:hypothetical protein